jgi:hypothetical protein
MSRKRHISKKPSQGLPTLLVLALLVGATALLVPFFLESGKEAAGPLEPPALTGSGSHAVPRTNEGPDIHFATTAVDFGIVPLNFEVGHSFSYANVGNATLKLERVYVLTLEGC